ncbi:MAG: class I SAM-dependent methyltransferase, partial [Nanoarchaeota archaeon]
MKFGRKLTNCRMCESNNLYQFLDLGFLPPAGEVLGEEELNSHEIFFPLKVAQCQDCGLTQLIYVVNPEILYGERYGYDSCITETGKKHFFEMANSICEKFKLDSKDLVVDIGSNVGVLLEGFKKQGCRILGIDPVPKIVEMANERGIETIRGLVSPEIAIKIVNEKGRAKIITATNVFAHIDNKVDLIKSLKILLNDEGIFIIEVPYFIDLIEKLAYDTIYLDHLEYLSVKPLVSFFQKNGFEVFDVQKYSIHGNSIRIFVSKKGNYNITENVSNFLYEEEKNGIYKREVLDEFANKVRKHKKEFINLIHE